MFGFDGHARVLSETDHLMERAPEMKGPQIAGGA
jgi:hypothetical protein